MQILIAKKIKDIPTKAKKTIVYILSLYKKPNTGRFLTSLIKKAPKKEDFINSGNTITAISEIESEVISIMELLKSRELRYVLLISRG